MHEDETGPGGYRSAWILLSGCDESHQSFVLDITWTFCQSTSSKTADYEMHQTKVQNNNFIHESSKLYIAVGQMSNKVITHNVDPACMCKNWGLLGKYCAANCGYTLSAGHVSSCTDTGPQVLVSMHLSDEMNWQYKGLTNKKIKVYFETESIHLSAFLTET
jgi:hypothetical protein